MLNNWKNSLTMESQVCIALRGVATVLATFILVTSAEARPRHECTQDSLEGAYGYSRTGPFVGVGPVAAVGLATFDGDGGLTAKDTISTNGKIVRRAGRGSYVVNPNCSNGTISHRIGRSATYIVKADCTVTEVFADGLTFDGVIVAGGREAYFVRTNPGTVITALYKKQSLHHDD